MEDLAARRKDEGAGRGRFSEYREPSNLFLRASVDPRAQGARDELRTKADAEHGLVARYRPRDEVLLVPQPRELFFIIRALRLPAMGSAEAPPVPAAE